MFEVEPAQGLSGGLQDVTLKRPEGIVTRDLQAAIKRLSRSADPIQNKLLSLWGSAIEGTEFLAAPELFHSIETALTALEKWGAEGSKKSGLARRSSEWDLQERKRQVIAAVSDQAGCEDLSRLFMLGESASKPIEVTIPAVVLVCMRAERRLSEFENLRIRNPDSLVLTSGGKFGFGPTATKVKEALSRCKTQAHDIPYVAILSPLEQLAERLTEKDARAALLVRGLSQDLATEQALLWSEYLEQARARLQTSVAQISEYLPPFLQFLGQMAQALRSGDAFPKYQATLKRGLEHSDTIKSLCKGPDKKRVTHCCHLLEAATFLLQATQEEKW